MGQKNNDLPKQLLVLLLMGRDWLVHRKRYNLIGSGRVWGRQMWAMSAGWCQLQGLQLLLGFLVHRDIAGRL